jgi:hypothetical protein
MAVQIQVWRRDPKTKLAAPAEILPKVYGGKYDALHRRYVGPADKVEMISCHEGQLPLLTYDKPGVLRVLALGPPGGGKTFSIVRRALLNAVERPNLIGGIVAPTGDRRQIVWRDFLELVEPLGWIRDVKESKKEIVLANGTIVQILSAKAPSAQQGNPLQGRNWFWCCVDESQNVDEGAHREIAARGRRAGQEYRIYESATKSHHPGFVVRLEQFKTNETYELVKFKPEQNPWLDVGWYERLKADMSDRDYREWIQGEDVPPEMLVYPAFSFAETVKPRNHGLRDITERVVHEKFNRTGIKYIVAQDFGVLTSTSEVLKCYQGPGGRRLWWAIDEITSYADVRADLHARKVMSRYSPEDVLVVADPHFNTKEADRSDYNLFRAQGLDIVPATHGKISRRHRIAMLNALLCDANGERSFFIDCDSNRNAKCPKLVESLMTLQYNDHGEAERDKKDYRDMTHWACAVGYGVYPWERIRGQDRIQVLK